MIKLDSQRKNFRFVFNCPFERKFDDFLKDVQNLADNLDSQGAFYAYIAHDKDIDKNGVLKTKHVHFVLVLPKRKRVGTLLYQFETLLNCPTQCISYDESLCLEYDIQYLTHKNDVNKYQYSLNEVFTNFDEDVFNEYYIKDVGEPVTPSLLYRYIEGGLTNTQIIFLIGVDKFNFYKGTIDVMRKDRIQQKKMWDYVGDYYHLTKYGDIEKK